MASENQTAANRANAKRSTGPRTESGKAKSRKNAFKHGLTAQVIVIEGEDPKEFEKLRAKLEEDFKPRTALETELVNQVTGLVWRLRRIPAFEAFFYRQPPPRN